MVTQNGDNYATGASGTILTGNGVGVTPTFQTPAISGGAFDQITVQVFTSTGTYTPTSGMKYCTIEVQAGGGGGGGAAISGAATGAIGGAGGGGGYSRKTVTAATIGASQAVTVGATANGGTAGNNAGTAGNTSSVGAIVSATGGGAGSGSAASQFANTNGAAGGVGSSGDFNIHGGAGNPSFQSFLPTIVQLVCGGNGGNSIFGAGGIGQTVTGGQSFTGNAGTTYGGGGAGGISTGNTAAAAGGNGAAGIVIITEYLSV